MKNNSLSVLIINDEEEMNTELQHMVEKSGHSVGVSSSCIGAIEKLSQAEFDMIFTDINISDCDGIELLQRLKTLYPEILVVALTDGLSRRDELKIRQSRVSCILIKPFTMYDIKGILDHVVRRKLMVSYNHITDELNCNPSC